MLDHIEIAREDFNDQGRKRRFGDLLCSNIKQMMIG